MTSAKGEVPDEVDNEGALTRNGWPRPIGHPDRTAPDRVGNKSALPKWVTGRQRQGDNDSRAALRVVSSMEMP